MRCAHCGHESDGQGPDCPACGQTLIDPGGTLQRLDDTGAVPPSPAEGGTTGSEAGARATPGPTLRRLDEGALPPTASDPAPIDPGVTHQRLEASADQPATGDLLLGGRYRVLRRLGAGGQGDVVLAHDESMERQVAIKRLTRLDRDTLARFRAEARSIAALSHPNICSVFDFVDDDSNPLMVMEYIEGETLSERVAATGPLPDRTLLQVARGVARALGSAHRRGVIHRDIKPANILLDDLDTPRLIDFGLGRKGDSSELTQSGTGMGTLDYVSPEQLKDATKVDHRSDIYSYGLTLYHAATGSTPRVMRDALIPKAWKALILQCLEPSPDDRPADMAAVEAALDGIEPRLAVRAGLPWLPIAAGTTVLALLGAAWGTGLLGGDPGDDGGATVTPGGMASLDQGGDRTGDGEPGGASNGLAEPPLPEAPGPGTAAQQPPPGVQDGAPSTAVDDVAAGPGPGSAEGGGTGDAATLPTAGEGPTDEEIEALLAAASSSEPPEWAELGGSFYVFESSPVMDRVLDQEHIVEMSLLGVGVSEDSDPQLASFQAGRQSREQLARDAPRRVADLARDALQRAGSGLSLAPRERTALLERVEAGATEALDDSRWREVGLSTSRLDPPRTFSMSRHALTSLISVVTELLLAEQEQGGLPADLRLPGPGGRRLSLEPWLASQSARWQALSADELTTLLDAGRPAPSTPVLDDGPTASTAEDAEAAVPAADEGGDRPAAGEPASPVAAEPPATPFWEDHQPFLRDDDGKLLIRAVGTSKLTNGPGRLPQASNIARDFLMDHLAELLQGIWRLGLQSKPEEVLLRDEELEALVDGQVAQLLQRLGKRVVQSQTHEHDNGWISVELSLPWDAWYPVHFNTAERSAGQLARRNQLTQPDTGLRNRLADYAWWYDSQTIEDYVGRLAAARERPWTAPGRQAPGGTRFARSWDEVLATPVTLTFAGLNQQGLAEFDLALSEGPSLRFVKLPEHERVYGSFQMGSPDSEDGRQSREGPRREVKVEAFLIAKHEVTRAQWRAVMGDDPSRFDQGPDDLPVDSVSWERATAFCEALGLALPSEAQWEYACRAGSESALPTGPLTIRAQNDGPQLAPLAWYAGNCGVDYPGGHDTSRWGGKAENHTRGGTQPVGGQQANAFGLHDMLGNVAEWCADTWHDDHTDAPADASPRTGGRTDVRPVRGGCWKSTAAGVRCAVREFVPADLTGADDLDPSRYGLRPVITLTLQGGR